jgi:hypothetical protein
MMIAMPQGPPLQITAIEELVAEEKGGAHLDI